MPESSKLYRFFYWFVTSQAYLSIVSALYVVAGYSFYDAKINLESVLPSILISSSFFVVYQVRLLVAKSSYGGFMEMLLLELRRKKALYLALTLSFKIFTLFILLQFISYKGLLLVSLLSTLSVFYSLPLYKPLKERPWKTNPFLTGFIISFIWASLASVYPALLLHELLSLRTLLFFLGNFCLIFSNCLPFDIRKAQYHKESTHFTITHTIGLFSTKLLALILLVGFLFIMEHLQISSFAIFPTFFLSLFSIFISSKKRYGIFYPTLLCTVIAIFSLLMIIFPYS